VLCKNKKWHSYACHTELWQPVSSMHGVIASSAQCAECRGGRASSLLGRFAFGWGLACARKLVQGSTRCMPACLSPSGSLVPPRHGTSCNTLVAACFPGAAADLLQWYITLISCKVAHCWTRLRPCAALRWFGHTVDAEHCCGARPEQCYDRTCSGIGCRLVEQV
jgi:hypothetical protein